MLKTNTLKTPLILTFSLGEKGLGGLALVPLAKGWFYPDFVADLVDGRLLVVEYKGKVYATNDDSREKKAVGELWAKKSGRCCLFLMAEQKNEKGQDVFQQIDETINV